MPCTFNSDRTINEFTFDGETNESEIENHTGRFAPSTTGALPRLRLGYVVDFEDLDADLWRVEFGLDLAGVDDELDALDGDRRLGHICRDDHLSAAAWRSLEHAQLLVLRQSRVQRQHKHGQLLTLLLLLLGAVVVVGVFGAAVLHVAALVELVEGLDGRVDLLLAGHEHEYVVIERRSPMQLQHGRYGREHVVALRLLGVEHVHLELAALEEEHGRLVEVGRELVDIHCS